MFLTTQEERALIRVELSQLALPVGAFVGTIAAS